MAHDPVQPPAPRDDEDEARAAAAATAFSAALEEFERERPGASGAGAARSRGKPRGTGAGPRVGQKLTCRVVAVSGDTLLLDIGGRSEAVADAGEFRAEDGTLAVQAGDSLELFVVEAGEQVVLARTARSRSRGSLEGVRQARTAEMPVRGKVTAVNTGGLSVDVDGVQAFCPLSQMDTTRIEDPSPFVGRVLEFLVTEVDESRHRVVLSRRRLLQRQQQEQARERLAALAPGQELEGSVTRLEPFGAFVDLGGIEGMVHVSEVSHARVSHPREAMAQGDRVRVKVLRVEPGRDGRPRVALSLRAAAPDPWSAAVQQFVPGTRVSGVVVRLADFGAFVNLAPGVDGLVHVSQVSDRRVQHVREVLSPGQAVEAVVLSVEPERRRIALSLREAQERPIPASRVRRATEPKTESESPAPAPREDDSPTMMQLAFRRAREAAERRGAK